MDEATSSLDYISELKIQEAIESLKGKLTQIIIAHRLNNIEHADYVIYMEKGRIVQQGTLDSIIKQCPNFSTLWELRH